MIIKMNNFNVKIMETKQNQTKSNTSMNRIEGISNFTRYTNGA